MTIFMTNLAISTTTKRGWVTRPTICLKSFFVPVSKVIGDNSAVEHQIRICYGVPKVNMMMNITPT
jgi:hypothetical protein